jgi:hypothetical protein
MSFLDADNIPMAESIAFEFEGEEGVFAPVEPFTLAGDSDQVCSRADFIAHFKKNVANPDDIRASHLYPITSQLQAPVIRYVVRQGLVHLFWVAFSVSNRATIEATPWPGNPLIERDRHILFLRYRDTPALTLGHDVGLARCQHTLDIGHYLRRDGPEPPPVDRILHSSGGA